MRCNNLHERRAIGRGKKGSRYVLGLISSRNFGKFQTHAAVVALCDEYMFFFHLLLRVRLLEFILNEREGNHLVGEEIDSLR